MTGNSGSRMYAFVFIIHFKLLAKHVIDKKKLFFYVTADLNIKIKIQNIV